MAIYRGVNKDYIHGEVVRGRVPAQTLDEAKRARCSQENTIPLATKDFVISGMLGGLGAAAIKQGYPVAGGILFTTAGYFAFDGALVLNNQF